MKNLGLLLLAALGFFDAPPAAAQSVVDMAGRDAPLAGRPEALHSIGRSDPVDRAQPPIDVVTVEGRYLGTISGQSLPSALGPERLAAYVETDELDVQRITVRRLPASWFAE